MSATNRGGVRRAGDAYQTPPSLCLFLVDLLPDSPQCILEPSTGTGNFVRALRTRHRTASIHAVEPYAFGVFADGYADHTYMVRFEDFMPEKRFDLIIGNPPYSLAEAHVRRALGMLWHGGKLAFLLRLAFLESQKRLPLWREYPPEQIHVLSERPSFTGGGTDSAAYGFFIWRAGFVGKTTLDVVSWKGVPHED